MDKFLGWQSNIPIALANGWKPLGGTMINRARGAPEGKRMTRKKGKTVGFLLLVRPPRRRIPARDARAPSFALSGENQNHTPAARSRTVPARRNARKPLRPFGRKKKTASLGGKRSDLYPY